MKNDLVSVALCTFNGEKYLRKQLDSILSQKYSPLEIIIVDDNSTDGTKEILTSYSKAHENIKVFFNDTNLGFNKNFEKAITLSKGDFIAISDQDDLWLPNKITRLVSSIGNNWLIFSNSEFVDSCDKPLNRTLLPYFEFKNNYRSILLENFVTGHTALLSKKIKEHILPIPDNGFYDWWIGFVAIYNDKIAYLEENLTYYRIHTNSVIQQALSDTKKVINPRKNLSEQLAIFLSYKNLKPSDKAFIEHLKENVDSVQSPVFKPIMPVLFKNFSTYFPKKEKKSVLSKINFLLKFLRTYGLASLYCIVELL